jgi:hypothetical protein
VLQRQCRRVGRSLEEVPQDIADDGLPRDDGATPLQTAVVGIELDSRNPQHKLGLHRKGMEGCSASLLQLFMRAGPMQDDVQNGGRISFSRCFVCEPGRVREAQPSVQITPSPISDSWPVDCRQPTAFALSLGWHLPLRFGFLDLDHGMVGERSGQIARPGRLTARRMARAMACSPRFKYGIIVPIAFIPPPRSESHRHRRRISASVDRLRSYPAGSPW